MILDTNALSAIADGEVQVVEHIARVREVAVPVIVLGEYRFGVAQSRHRRQYERWLSELLATVKILEVNAETAVHYANLRSELRESGTPLPANDVWIAALCGQYAMPILSRDRHFDLVRGLTRLGW